MTAPAINPCILIPVYNHPDKLAHTLSAIVPYEMTCILVDDGSDAECKSVIQALTKDNPAVVLITRAENGGKGAAVKSGLIEANKRGFTHALQLDADGQHDTADIPRFIAAAEQAENALIAGVPRYDDSVPRLRFYARYLTHVWVWINTLSLSISDSMCGFRLYPVPASCELIEAHSMGNRMDFDCDFIVRWYWQDWPIQELKTKVIYPEQSVSHFRGVEDNALISLMHAKAFFGMLRRFIPLMRRKFR